MSSTTSTTSVLTTTTPPPTTTPKATTTTPAPTTPAPTMPASVNSYLSYLVNNKVNPPATSTLPYNLTLSQINSGCNVNMSSVGSNVPTVQDLSFVASTQPTIMKGEIFIHTVGGNISKVITKNIPMNVTSGSPGFIPYSSSSIGVTGGYSLNNTIIPIIPSSSTGFTIQNISYIMAHPLSISIQEKWNGPTTENTVNSQTTRYYSQFSPSGNFVELNKSSAGYNLIFKMSPSSLGGFAPGPCTINNLEQITSKISILYQLYNLDNSGYYVIDPANTTPSAPVTEYYDNSYIGVL